MPEYDENGAGDKVETGSPRATASYIADLTGEMSNMARQAGLDVVAYLLDMAKLEAEETAKGEELPRKERS